MKANLDIENSKTQEVITILLPVLEFEETGHIIFDISKVNDKEKELILDAINPELGYTDIEMFFIDDDDVPYFGPDYNYSISDNKLILDYKYDKRKHVLKKKNEDWTFMFEEEVNKILKEFLKQSNDYLLVYYDNGVKYKVLDYNPDKDIFMYINSPGGVITSGMAIYDTMQYIKPDVATLCIGQACSMGSFLLAGGAKGKRYALPNARIMIHQPLGGFQGQATDIEIQAAEIIRIKKSLK